MIGISKGSGRIRLSVARGRALKLRAHGRNGGDAAVDQKVRPDDIRGIVRREYLVEALLCHIFTGSRCNLHFAKMPSKCPNSRLIVANIVSRSGELLTSARMAKPPAPTVSSVPEAYSLSSHRWRSAPFLSNPCDAASPIPPLPPVIRKFLFANLPIIVTPSD